MTIEAASIGHLDEIFSIFRACREDLEKKNIFQWTGHYPTIETFSRDIESRTLFTLRRDGTCLGMITLNTVQDAEYQAVDWKDKSGKALVIHRLAVHPLYQSTGIARKLMDFAEDFARQGFSSVRLDAYSANARSLGFYEKRGYLRRGEIYFPGRTLPFFCYEKIL